MPYLARLEKAGIPTVLVDLADQHEMVKQEALVSGVPKIRHLHASRTVPGPADVDTWIKKMLDELLRPLSEEEKGYGQWKIPQDRIIFEGTMDEAEEFFQQTRYVPHPVNANISVYTDGFPIVIPTEERVAKMLKGTSHKPDEIVTLVEDLPAFIGAMGRETKQGKPVLFHPLKRTATVERIAVNAVMCGCKPEHLPVVLAIAQSGCNIVTTNFPSQAVCLSGPIIKEIGLNIGVGHLGPGSPVNGPIGRSYQMMAINLSGAVPGINRMGCHGNPMNNGGMCFGENGETLPDGWDGMNVEARVSQRRKRGHGNPGFRRHCRFPVLSRRLPGPAKSGHGGIARRFGVKGKPGPHNWLNYIVPGIWAGREGGTIFIMVAELAQHLKDLGFKTKDEVYEWIWKQSFEPLKDYRNRSWPDFSRNGWMGIEKTSGKPWKELPDDYMVPVAGDEPFESCIIIAGGDEEAAVEILGSRGEVFSIDAWR